MDWVSPILSAAGTVALFSLQLALWPLSTLLGFLVVLLSPVTYTIQYTAAPFLLAIGIFPKLEPLYIFFGVAAFVGIIAGTSLHATSGVIVAIFGLDEESGRAVVVRRKATSGSGASTPAEFKRLEELPSSQESEWQWLERAPESSTRRRRTQGLLSQTILEEDDNSE